MSVNSTIDHLLLSSTTTSVPTEPANAYDHQGAALYIAVILVWYSTGLAMMLFLQIRPRSLQQQFLFDSSDSSRKARLQSLTKNPFTNYRNIQADNTTKQILNELKDPERRQRLWKIYYASTEKHDEPYPQYYQTITSDGATIDRIKRKLADIHRMDTINDQSPAVEIAAPSSTENRSLALVPFDSTKFFSKRFPSLRRPNGNSTNPTTVPLVRIQTPDESSSNTNSRKQAAHHPKRFTVEKVSDNTVTTTTTAEKPQTE